MQESSGALEIPEGTSGAQRVENGSPGLVHICGYPQVLSLDERFRFRIPDDLAQRLHREMGRVAGDSHMPPAAFERLSLYFVAGPNQRILLFAPCNIRVPMQRFENPPPGADPVQIRAARDYFYRMMQFVEADRQNRFVIPEHLRQHGGIDEPEREVLLITHDLWLVLVRSSLAREEDRMGREALDQLGADIIDPVRVSRNPPAEGVQ